MPIGTNGNISFFMSELYSTLHMYHIFLYQSPVDGYFSYFLVLAFVEKNCCYEHLRAYIFSKKFLSFLDICIGVGFLDYMVDLFLIFKGIPILFSLVTIPIYISTTVWEGSLFSSPSPARMPRLLVL